jgi:hypothetical protein
MSFIAVDATEPLILGALWRYDNYNATGANMTK